MARTEEARRWDEGRVDKSRGIETRMAAASAKVKPTDPLRSAIQAARRNLNLSVSEFSSQGKDTERQQIFQVNGNTGV